MAGSFSALIFFFINVAILHAEIADVKFMFHSFRNITILETAIFNCSVDHEAVSIQWQVNGTSSKSDKITSLGIVTIGAATQNSSLIVQNASAANESTITCIASGLINGESYFNSDSSILYIQGKPDPPDLKCQFGAFFKIYCNWLDPFLLMGLEVSDYKIEVFSAENELLANEKSPVHRFNYTANKLGIYIITVVSYIDNLEGKAREKSFDVKNEKVAMTETSLQLEAELEEYTLFIKLKLNDTDGPTIPSGIKGSINISENELQPIEGNFTNASAELVMGMFLLDGIDTDKLYTINISLSYSESEIKVPLGNPVTISTFSVQYGNFSLNDAEICFTCKFLKGCNAKGCHVELIDEELKVLKNITIPKNEEELISSGCVLHIFSSIHSILFYDIEVDGNIGRNNVAYELRNTNIPPLDTIKPTLSVPDIRYTLTSSTELTPATVSSTVKSDGRPGTLIMVTTATLSLIVFSIVTIITVIMTLRIMHYCKHRQKNHVEQCINRHSNDNIYELHQSSSIASLTADDFREYAVEPIKHYPVSTQPRHYQFQSVDDTYQKLDHSQNRLQLSSPHSSDVANNSGEYSKFPFIPLQVLDEYPTTDCDPATHHSDIDVVYPHNMLTYNFMKNFVIPKLMVHKWKCFGLAVGLSPAQIKEIQDINVTNELSSRTFCDVVMLWSTEQPTPFTWNTLISVLKSECMDENQLATDLINKRIDRHL